MQNLAIREVVRAHDISYMPFEVSIFELINAAVMGISKVGKRAEEFKQSIILNKDLLAEYMTLRLSRNENTEQLSVRYFMGIFCLEEFLRENCSKIVFKPPAVLRDIYIEHAHLLETKSRADHCPLIEKLNRRFMV